MYDTCITSNSIYQLDSHQNNLYYLFAYAGIYAIIALVPKKESIPERIYLATIMWNAVSFLVLVIGSPLWLVIAYKIKKEEAVISVEEKN